MSVSIRVPLAAMADPAVATAVETLFAALGAAIRAGGAAPTPVARPVAAPDAPAASVDAGTEARWARFLGALPARSQRFLELVESRGTVGIAEAMDVLGVEIGKAMGGVTGSIARWAPEYDVTVPFEAVRGPDGKRAWRWIGLGREPAPPMPVRKRRRRRAPSTRQPAETVAAPAERTAAPDPAERVTAMKAELEGPAATFLALLEVRGVVTQADALAHFGLARAQGLRAALRPIEEAAERHGLSDLLATDVTATGDRSWRWGAEREQPRPLSPRAPRASGMPGVRVRRRAADR